MTRTSTVLSIFVLFLRTTFGESGCTSADGDGESFHVHLSTHVWSWKPELRAPKCNCWVKYVEVLASSLFLSVPVPEVYMELAYLFNSQVCWPFNVQTCLKWGGDSCMQKACKIRPVNPLFLYVVFVWGVMPVSLSCSLGSLWPAIKGCRGSDFSCSWQFPPKKMS